MSLPALEKLGAKQIAPVGGTVGNSRRLDIVYSIMEGFPPNGAKALAGYVTNSFGVTFAKGAAAADSDARKQKYGVTPAQPFRSDTIPNCYYKLATGQKLEEILRQVLTQEEKVWRVNLNYFDR